MNVLLDSFSNIIVKTRKGTIICSHQNESWTYRVVNEQVDRDYLYKVVRALQLSIVLETKIIVR